MLIMSAFVPTVEMMKFLLKRLGNYLPHHKKLWKALRHVMPLSSLLTNQSHDDIHKTLMETQLGDDKEGRQNTLVAALKHRSLPGLVCGEKP